MGIDIGGTKLLGGVVDPDGNVLAHARRDTPAEDGPKIVKCVVEMIRELSEKHEVEGVGIGAAGWIDAKRSTVLFAPNLAWRNEPLRDEVARHIPVPVVVENDANVAAWAEFQFGAGADANESMVMFTIGTGIGGALVLGGELMRGANGIAGELGHVLAVPGGHPCGCGRLGCIEQYASGNALVRFVPGAGQGGPDRRGTPAGVGRWVDRRDQRTDGDHCGEGRRPRRPRGVPPGRVLAGQRPGRPRADHRSAAARDRRRGDRRR
jgi:glucokinase